MYLVGDFSSLEGGAEGEGQQVAGVSVGGIRHCAAEVL